MTGTGHPGSGQGLEFDPFAGPELALTAPSTEAQREVWTASQLGDEASRAFNESVSLALRGPLDVEALLRALSRLVARHEAMRTTFSPDGMTLCVTSSPEVSVPLIDLAALPGPERASRVATLLREEVEKPFHLETGPLFRLHLVRLAPEDHLLVQTAHHIVCDGFSTAVLMRDLARLYSAEHRGIPADLPPAMPFSAYALEMAARNGTPDHAAEERFWLGVFSDLVPPLELPGDRPRPRLKSYPSARIDHTIGANQVRALKEVGARSGTSFFGTLLSTFALFLSRLCGQEEVVVGIPSAGQIAAGHPQLVGHCVNTLPLRLRVAPDGAFPALAAQVRSTLLDALDHQQYTLGTLLRALAVPRDPSRLPLVSVLFNLDQGLSADALPFDGIDASLRSNPRRFENFDLFVNAVEQENGVVFECQYNTDLFDSTTVGRWLASFEALLDEVAGGSVVPVGRIPMLTEQDTAIQSSCNDTSREYPRNRLLHELVEEQVDRAPEAVAIAFGGVEISFAQLDRRANRLAHHLIGLGAGPDVLVGLFLDRLPEMLVAMLAIQKAGAAYVPLDPAFPAERLAFMVADSRMPLVVTQGALRANMPPHQASIVDLDVDRDAVDRMPATRPARRGHPGATAYALYTSGSTGKPKGVQVPVSAVVNFLWSVRGDPGLGPDDRLVAVTTLSFDIAVLELWLPLVVGARIVLASRDQAMDGAALRVLLESSGATAMQATPATWRMLVGSGWQGTPGFKAICGGEALPPDLAVQLASRAALWNMYGPTETTVWSTSYRVPPEGVPVYIGRPLANTQVHVLDRMLQPVPVGVPGELFIGGDGVTLGYLNRPELTAERFLGDPFRSTPGARIYRTGDLVRLRPDGNLEFIGRNDGQVKVRGFRIELGEIEAALARHSGVGQGMAMVREDRVGDVRIVAYVVTRPGCSAEEDELREHVRRILPEYMVPQHVLRVDAFPLTPNGKIDRKALPAPDGSAGTANAYVPPRNEVEGLVASLWQEALGIARIGIHDDFFGLGGHSLLAAQVISRLAVQHGLTVPMRRMFEYPTVAQFAAALGGERVPTPISRIPDDGPIPASFMQERIWNLEQLRPGRAVFNLPSAFRLRGRLDVTALHRSLEAFVVRQEAARTTLRSDGEGVVQLVRSRLPVPMEVVDLSSLEPATREAELMRRMLEESIAPFDLEHGPLVRARLYRLGDEEHAVFFMPHHAIWDGWSFDILVREWAELYEAALDGRPAALAPLPVRYRDFAAWHRSWLRSPEVEKQAAWWRDQLAGNVPPLDLPLDRPRSRSSGDGGGTLWVEMPRSEVDALTSLAQAHGTTLFTVLLAAWQALLHRMSGQEQVLVGTPLRGRNRPELDALVGTFVNTLVLRTSFAGNPTFSQVLERVRATVLGAFRNEDVPFEFLAMGQKPVYRALFSFQDARGRASRFGSLAIHQLHVLPPVAANDVSLWMMERDSGVIGGLNFSTELFDRDTIARLLAGYRLLLRSAVADPGCAVSRLMIAEGGDLSLMEGSPPGAPGRPILEDLASHVLATVTVEDPTSRTTMGAIQARAVALREELRGKGLRAGDLVALLARPSIDALANVLAVAGLGAATFPLDPDDPESRIAAMLLDAAPRLVLGGECQPWAAGPGALSSGAPAVETARLRALPGEPVGVILSPGGAGRPLPSGVPWSAVTAAVQGVRTAARLSQEHVHLVTAATSPGGWLLPTVLGLASGGRVVLDGDPADDVERLRSLLERSGANVLCAPAHWWRRLVDSGWSGGDRFTALCLGPVGPDLARVLAGRVGTAMSIHSPASGVWSGAAHLHSGMDLSDLGSPFPGFRWTIVDSEHEPVPRGVPGELLVAMVGAEDAPCRPTGERARLRSDGRLEHLGFIDHRVVFRGHAFAPGEVEAALESHPSVSRAAAGTRPDELGEERLVGWLVRADGIEATSSELRAHLRTLLPDRMVPRHFVDLDSIPEEGGRVARESLPSPFASPEPDAGQVEPRTDAERFIAGVWATALGLSKVGLHDNFFDLGGHSLLCLQVVAQIERSTGRRLSPRLFLLNTVEQVAAQLPAGSAPAI